MIRERLGRWSMPKDAVEVTYGDSEIDYWVPAYKYLDGTVYNWRRIEQNRLGIWREIDCWSTGFGGLTVESG